MRFRPVDWRVSLSANRCPLRRDMRYGLPMTDEHFPLSPTAPPPPTEADYEAIAAAVMETVRGRWFLGEFAKRNRNADTELILERIDRIDTLLREPAPVSPAERVRIDLVEMAKAIAQTRREIAALKPDGDTKGTLSEASEELDSIVQTTERATSDILAAAERIQEVAWTMRERGTDGVICDALDQRAADIYSACSFQDLTGQRTRKVVDVLQFLEDRIRAMIEIWGGTVPEQDGAPAPTTAPHVGEDRSVPHLEQQEIDRMMPAGRPAAPPAEDPGIAASASAGPAGGIATAEAAVAAVRPEAAVVETVMMPVAAVVGATALALDFTPIAVARQPEPAPAPELEPAQPPEATPESDAQAEAVPQSAPQPEPVVAPEPEPAAEIEAVATPSEPRADPAAILKRILAIIRAPNEPLRPLAADADSAAPAIALAAEPAVGEASAAHDVTAMSAEPAALPEVGTAQSGMAKAEPVVAAVAVVTADIPGSDAAAVAEPPRSNGDTPQHAREHAGQAAIDDEAADDILMPLPGLLTVDQAVNEMLKAPGRVDVAATLVPVGAAVPEPEAPNEPPAAEPVAGETGLAAGAGISRPLVIEVPEFGLARPPAPASQQKLAAEPQPERGHLEPEFSPAAATAAAAEPPAPPVELRSEPLAPEVAPPTGAVVLPPSPPLEPVAEVPVPLVAPAPPAAAAAEPPPLPADAAAPPPAPPVEVAAARPVPRHPALAVIAALSDDDKIALFS